MNNEINTKPATPEKPKRGRPPKVREPGAPRKPRTQYIREEIREAVTPEGLTAKVRIYIATLGSLESSHATRHNAIQWIFAQKKQIKARDALAKAAKKFLNRFDVYDGELDANLNEFLDDIQTRLEGRNVSSIDDATGQGRC